MSVIEVLVRFKSWGTVVAPQLIDDSNVVAAPERNVAHCRFHKFFGGV